MVGRQCGRVRKRFVVVTGDLRNCIESVLRTHAKLVMLSMKTLGGFARVFDLVITLAWKRNREGVATRKLVRHESDHTAAVGTAAQVRTSVTLAATVQLAMH